MIQDGMCLANPDMRSILMIGQSNMAGRGDFGEVAPIRNDMCFMLRMGRWQRMSEPINPDRDIFSDDFHSGISLAASFADEYARKFSAAIGLIPCADGGTKLSQWMPGEVLFDHAVMQANLAQRTSTLSGIIWHQGESDCHNENDVLEYKQKFLSMITELRRRIGGQSIPVIIGELSTHIGERWGLGNRPVELNKIFSEIAKELPMCAVASSHGLTLKSDEIHFNSESCRIFGKRYFERFLSVVDSSTNTEVL